MKRPTWPETGVTELEELFPLMSEITFLGELWCVDSHESTSMGGIRYPELTIKQHGKTHTLSYTNAKALRERISEESARQLQEALDEWNAGPFASIGLNGTPEQKATLERFISRGSKKDDE